MLGGGGGGGKREGGMQIPYSVKLALFSRSQRPLYTVHFCASSTRSSSQGTEASDYHTTTPAPPKDEPKTSMFVDCSKFDFNDLLGSGAIVIGFLASFFADKRGESRYFLLAHCLLFGIHGLASCFFPALSTEYQVGDIP